jgi:hypothetical protein
VAKVPRVKPVAKHKAKALSAAQILHALGVSDSQVKAVQSSLSRMGLIKRPARQKGAKSPAHAR